MRVNTRQTFGRYAVLAALMLAVFTSSAAMAQMNAFKEPKTATNANAGISGPDISPVETEIKGGSVAIGGTIYVVALFQNKGTAPVKVTGINLYPSSTVSAQVALNQCSEGELAPEGQCAITLTVTGIQEGPWRVEILLDHNGRARLALAAITGDIQPSKQVAEQQLKPEIEAIPNAIDFGNSTGGLPLVRSIVFRNSTAETIDIKDVSLNMPSEAGFTLKPDCPAALKAGEACNASIVWTPFTKGLSQGFLLMRHSGQGVITQVEVRGSFEPQSVASATIYPEAVPDKGLLITDKDKVDFGGNVTGASAITVSLVNAGSTNLTIRNIRLSGSDNGLSIARIGCAAGMTLAPVEACPLTINWVPSRAGEIIDDLQIQHNGARGILVLPVRGDAEAAVSRETLVIRQTHSLKRSFQMDATPVKDAKPSAEEKKPEKPEKDEKSSENPETGKKLSEKPADEKEVEDIAAKTSAMLSAEAKLSADTPPPLYFGSSEDVVPVTPVLDGYVITSHSPSRAIINSPVGSMVVRDGEDVVISGVSWMVSIVSTGVVLSNATDEILLVFDQSLRPGVVSRSGSSGSSGNSGGNDAASTTASSPAATPPTAGAP